MRAVAVTPHVKDSARMLRVPDIHPGAEEALVRLLRVGVCGTDRELNEGLYGEAPPGEEFLIIGHESLGRVEAVGSKVQGLWPGELVVATVRRPDDCPNCKMGEYDMCLWGGYTERGIKGRHGFMAEFYVEEPQYLVKVPEELEDVAVLLEPLSVVEKAVSQSFKIQDRMAWQPERALVLGAGTIGLLAAALLRLRGLEVHIFGRRCLPPKAELMEMMEAKYLCDEEGPLPALGERLGHIDLIIEATGSSALAFQALRLLGNNGVLCLTGIQGGHRTLEIESDLINREMVLGNKVAFGTVNANRKYFEMGISHMKVIKARWPGLLSRMITRRLSLDDWAQALRVDPEGIKTVIECQR